MRPPRWKALVDKSIAACCAAIEIYNKPVSIHREETFAILAISAWELLLKARLLKEGNNKLAAVYEFTPVLRKDGACGARKKVRRNRAGNPATISLGAALHRTCELKNDPLSTACRENLNLLTEIRDNAVHFVNDDRELATKVHEIGAASLVNYVQIATEWFGCNLGAYRFAILPLSFDRVRQWQVTSGRRSAQAANLLAHMKQTCAAAQPSADGRFAVSLQIETRIVGSRSTDAVPMKLSREPDAVKVEMTEEQFRERWPHDYDRLIPLVRQRVPGLKLNRDFHIHKRSLEGDEQYARVRLLDINNPKSSKKTYYSTAMVDVLVARIQQAAANAPQLKLEPAR